MAKTKLKRMDRFELLELIYDMRKVNLDLTERLEAAEKKIEELKKEADQRVLDVRSEYVQRLDDLRMQGAAKELQKRMNEIEEQLIMFQQITGKGALSANQESPDARKEEPASVYTPPAHKAFPKQEAVQDAYAAETAAPLQDNEARPDTPGSQSGESRE